MNTEQKFSQTKNVCLCEEIEGNESAWFAELYQRISFSTVFVVA